jgi:hypothetical protein
MNRLVTLHVYCPTRAAHPLQSKQLPTWTYWSLCMRIFQAYTGWTYAPRAIHFFASRYQHRQSGHSAGACHTQHGLHISDRVSRCSNEQTGHTACVLPHTGCTSFAEQAAAYMDILVTLHVHSPSLHRLDICPTGHTFFTE